VAWNVSAPGNQIVVQKPPIGQNYAIGCNGHVTHIGPFNPHPAGWIEGTGETVIPASLYEAQLSERMAHGVGPDAPARLNISDSSWQDTTGNVTLEWIDIALDEDQYVVERSYDGGKTFEVVAQLLENTRSFTDSGLLQGSYLYRVKAVNSIGSSAWSNTVGVDLTNDVTSDIFPDLKIFPNPFRDHLMVETGSTVKKLVLYDALGRIVRMESTKYPGGAWMDAKGLANGIYILHIHLDDKGMAYVKLVKSS
jgi:hypothetical protein